MGIDLLRQREAWKTRWTAMKDMVNAQIKRRSYPAEHCAKWLLHWVYQAWPCWGWDGMGWNAMGWAGELVCWWVD